MGIKSRLHFDSLVIQEDLTPDQWQGSTLPPIFQSASTQHATAQSLSDTFAGMIAFGLKNETPCFSLIDNLEWCPRWKQR